MTEENQSTRLPQSTSEAPATLTRLPQELTERIASYLEGTDLSNLQQTCKQLQSFTHDVNIQRKFHIINVGLSVDGLRELLAQLRHFEAFRKVHEIHSTGIRVPPKKRYWYWHKDGPGLQTLALLTELLSKLPALHLLSLYGKSPRPFTRTTPHDGFRESGEIFFEALSHHRIPSLSTLTFNFAELDAFKLSEVLSMYKENRLSLTFNSVYVYNGVWFHVWQDMKMGGSLSALAFLNPSDMIMADYHWLNDIQRVNGAVRNPDTGKIESYSIWPGQFFMTGSQAIQVGLEKLFGIIRSRW